MPLTRLDHYSIRTTDLETSRNFYVDVLGMVDGDRPPFPFPGYWLYVGDRPVVHLIGIDADDPSGLVNYMGEDRKDAFTGSGAVDHVAFNGEDIEEQRGRLRKLGIDIRERDVPGMPLQQIFIKDPNGITVELNFWSK